ncbi:MAG: response regulator transcription factor [Clostridia bacterium]|nr:response regulator transcription factor [Clostridia bacterium]
MDLRIAICDDEQKQIEYLTSLVSSWGNKTSVTCTIDTFQSAESFLFDYAEDKNRDILLLDIEMGGMNGVDLAKTIRRTNDTIQIIFITGFPDFIAEGYEVSALHYLMKPVLPEKLHTVLDKAAANLAKSEKRLSITYDRQTDFVPLSQVMYIEAQKQYILIHTIS